MNILFAVFVVLTFLCQSLVGHCDQLKPVIDEIRYEATLPEENPVGRPLPLAAHWNTGLLPGTFTPDYQLQLISKGHYLLPSIQLPGHPKASSDYYAHCISLLAQYNLPFTFISTQWESILTNDQRFFGLPIAQNPNVVDLSGNVLKKVSPFGPSEYWYEAGKIQTSDSLLAKIAERYPKPPMIVFLSNNEHPKLRWTEVNTSKRYIERYGTGKSDEFKRRVVGDGWIERYGKLLQGMKDGLPSQWKTVPTIFEGYNAFGCDAFGRWSGWINYSLYITGRFEPWPLVWNGASASYYLYDWDPSTDFTVWSPQVRAMNYVFMLEESKKMNPNFWFELSVWDGHEPGRDSDKREYYKRIGQAYTPERYAGMIQFGMWLLRPRVIREFRGWTQTVKDNEPYFLALLSAVDRVHTNSILRRFWRTGTLVPNTAHAHPYQANIPDEYKTKNRWFLLDTNLDPPWPWALDTEIPVFSLALVMGTKPRREWLLYVFSPGKLRENVLITVPDYKKVAVSASPSGKFFLIQEEKNSIREIANTVSLIEPPKALKIK